MKDTVWGVGIFCLTGYAMQLPPIVRKYFQVVSNHLVGVLLQLTFLAGGSRKINSKIFEAKQPIYQTFMDLATIHPCSCSVCQICWNDIWRPYLTVTEWLLSNSTYHIYSQSPKIEHERQGYIQTRWNVSCQIFQAIAINVWWSPWCFSQKYLKIRLAKKDKKTPWAVVIALDDCSITSIALIFFNRFIFKYFSLTLSGWLTQFSKKQSNS